MDFKKNDVNLKQVSSKQLIVDLKKLVGKELEILSQILNYLREVEARRLFVPMGYSSLFDFCTRELGYSSDQAYRRICAMRLVREVPEAKEKLDSGALALSSAAELYRFMSAQKKLAKSPQTETGIRTDVPSVAQLLNYACENSKQALQQKLLETAEKTGAQKYIARESVKPVTSDLTEFKITLPSAIVRKLKTLQDAYSNKLKDGGVGKLVELLIDAEMERIEKLRMKSLKRDEKSRSQAVASPKAKANNKSETRAPAAAITLSAKGMMRHNQVDGLAAISGSITQILHQQDLSYSLRSSRYISAHTKRFIKVRDQNRCQQPGCHATRYLHFDHIIPLSRGGKTNTQNLQLLCSAHNIAKGASLPH